MIGEQKKSAAVDAANIGGSKAGKARVGAIPKNHISIVFLCRQAGVLYSGV